MSHPTFWSLKPVTTPLTLQSMPAISRQMVSDQLDAWLQPHLFNDYGPNGLQVEGAAQVQHVVSGVTASLALIEQAADMGADAIFVHHGLFWRGQTGVVTGWMRKRLGLLIERNINLWAYHLPLDAHETLGNNVQLARVLGLTPDSQGGKAARFGDQGLGWLGRTSHTTLGALVDATAAALRRPVVVIGDADKPVSKVAWCTGGAQSYFEQAIAAGADVFISGELSEPQAHYARECDVAYIACGHHASERYGAQAVGHALASQFGLQHTFVDIDNPA
jgi:dinuclear metal center YbgI/SA1388 family protein